MLCKIRKNTLPIGFDWKVSAISYSKGCAPFTKCVEELRTFVLLFHTISQRFVNSERIFLYEPYTFCVHLIVLRLLAWLLTWGIVLTIWVLTAGHFCADSLGVFVLTVWALRLWSLPATWTCPKEEKSGMSFAKVDSPPSSWPVSCVGAAGSKLSLTLALFIPVICRCGLPFPCPQLVCKLVRDWPVLDQTPLKMTSAWSDASENDTMELTLPFFFYWKAGNGIWVWEFWSKNHGWTPLYSCVTLNAKRSCTIIWKCLKACG